MENTRTNTAPTIRADNDQNNTQRADDVIWLSAYAQQLSAKEGARRANMTPSGFKKIQSGECAIRFEKWTHWLRGDPDLAAAYMVHVGLIRPGEAEFAAAYTRACHAAARAKQARGE